MGAPLQEHEEDSLYGARLSRHIHLGARPVILLRVLHSRPLRLLPRPLPGLRRRHLRVPHPAALHAAALADVSGAERCRRADDCAQQRPRRLLLRRVDLTLRHHPPQRLPRRHRRRLLAHQQRVRAHILRGVPPERHLEAPEAHHGPLWLPDVGGGGSARLSKGHGAAQQGDGGGGGAEAAEQGAAGEGRGGADQEEEEEAAGEDRRAYAERHVTHEGDGSHQQEA
mmetsp:Transcript_25993/g.65561  ORF Transcript_25993/g.65561 Transcript_25993/m.65561 type:complete len:226 (+) Transcript_25993:1307-1984(+)